MPEVARGHVKTGEGIGQMGGREVRQEMVEKSQGIAHLPAEAGVGDGVEGLGPVDEAQGPPVRPGPAFDVVPASRRQDYLGHLKGAARAWGLSAPGAGAGAR